MADEEYMAFCCNDLEHPCDFRIQARTREEVREHARTHLAREHNLEGPEAENRIEGAIRPTSAEK
jgi:predicted small metal-binding protein